jgi:hypothetical protein
MTVTFAVKRFNATGASGSQGKNPNVMHWEKKSAFLGAFAELRKVTFSFMSVCTSFRMQHFGSHWTHFREIWYLSIFRKSVAKILVSLKPDKNNGYFT